MTLEDIYGANTAELKINKAELGDAADIIDEWLAGGEVDPDLAHYVGMMCLSLSQIASEVSDAEYVDLPH